MAAVMSAKRPRALTSSIDLGGRSQNSRNKRARHSAESSAGSSDNESEPELATDDDANAVLEQQRASEQEQWATQQVQKDFRETANKQNIATDSGIIEEIQCINFMCHEHLTVTLGPLINFIIGHNGSGKSAVLTALTICLGGKATATNRAQNLKSLIKEGKDHSSVQVRIKNQGALAYKPKEYGDSITVERHFNRTGTSGFKLRDHNGKVMSTKKAELEDILDAFSMQIDNPMNVLTQDMARQFLNHSTPKDKYKFFLQGTQLEVLSKDYQQIEQSLELMNTRAEVKKSDIAVLRKRMEDLAAKARRAESLERMRAKETELAHQALWAHVQEDEAFVARTEKGLEEVAADVMQKEQLVAEASKAYEDADAAHEAAVQSVTDVAAEIEPAKQEVEEKRAIFNECKKSLMALLPDQRSTERDIKAKAERVAGYKDKIENLRRLQAEADDGVYAEKVRQLEVAKAEMETARIALSEHGPALPALQNQVKADQIEKQKAEQRVQRAKDEESTVLRSIRNLQGGKGDWMEGFPQPQNLAKLLRAIETDGHFREKPVGPMGRYVKLLRPEWAFILEKQFGLSLNAFVVTSRADQTTLSNLMRRCNWQFPVLIGNSNPIDTRNNEPDPTLLTCLRVLKIENHLVRNQLIINQSIDQTVLMEGRTEGYNFMNTGPRNVRMCFTFSEGSKRKGRVLNFVSNGEFNESPIAEYRGQLRMQADKADQIKAEEARLLGIRQELEDLEQTATNLLNQLNSSRGIELDHHRKNKQLKIAHQEASESVACLEEELSKAVPDAAEIDVAQVGLGDAEAALVIAEGVYEDIVLQKDKLNAENRENKKNLEKAQVDVADLENKLNKAKGTVRIFQGKREDCLKKKNQAITSLAAHVKNKEDWTAALEKARSELDTVVQNAVADCPQRIPVPEGQTAEQLGKTLQTLMNTRRLAEKELGGSQDQLLRAANEAKRVHQDARREFDALDGLKTHLINTVNNRRQRWQQFRSGISVRARVTFTYLLSERKFRGDLKIDHKKALLDIHVQPDSTERSGEGRQTKTLSGGEKSYSTVCLLLALWDAMGSPIRCLDEFDVFMDSVNRERSMDMIIQAARRSIGRQFIFITPQAMNNVKHTSDVKIIRMSDPERNQTALSFRPT
ncbi:hypothetical protein BDU57DRAFT_465075 [Ampelomyces quisqualis]|uniref:RecF/RecN/SMC N-terminal domain-containing protein n=1 Tax=Ampelomyces quisqualis TaxID=50730 RepID=A0A6A5R0B4_AMPQU|nr:hypothetical protein BDU57DRAFT_465075 [Ampelomyces quisqualis]